MLASKTVNLSYPAYKELVSQQQDQLKKITDDNIVMMDSMIVKAFDFWRVKDPEFAAIIEKIELVRCFGSNKKHLNAQFELSMNDLNSLQNPVKIALSQKIMRDQLVEYLNLTLENRVHMSGMLSDHLNIIRDFIIESAKIHLRIAKMEIIGVDTPEDLRFIFDLVIGRINIGLYAEDESIIDENHDLQNLEITSLEKRRAISPFFANDNFLKVFGSAGKNKNYINEPYHSRKKYLLAKFPKLFDERYWFNNDIFKLGYSIQRLTEITLLNSSLPYYEHFHIYRSYEKEDNTDPSNLPEANIDSDIVDIAVESMDEENVVKDLKDFEAKLIKSYPEHKIILEPYKSLLQRLNKVEDFIIEKDFKNNENLEFIYDGFNGLVQSFRTLETEWKFLCERNQPFPDYINKYISLFTEHANSLEDQRNNIQELFQTFKTNETIKTKETVVYKQNLDLIDLKLQSLNNKTVALFKLFKNKTLYLIIHSGLGSYAHYAFAENKSK